MKKVSVITPRGLKTIIWICAVCFILSAIAAFSHFSQPPDAPMAVTGRNDLRYTVYYLDNEFFGEGERPRSTHYLMSHTDNIRVKNELSLNFSQYVDLTFQFDVSETFIILDGRPGNGNGDRNGQTVVFQEEAPLFSTEGSASGREFTWGANPSDGYFTIEPREHIENFWQFLEAQQEVMEREGFVPQRIGFNAELRVAFRYAIQAGGISRVLRREAVIPLSSEVYRPELTGEDAVEIAAEESSAPAHSPLALALAALWLVVLATVIGYCVRRLAQAAQERRGEAGLALQKYTNLIIPSLAPVDTSGHIVIQVPEFKELLKLAAGLNKNIICYQGGDRAEFCAFDDRLAYCYTIFGEMEQEPHGLP